MKVFILGGEHQHYLQYQVAAIKQFVIDCEDIVYVTGPTHSNRLIAASTDHVDPIVNLTLLRLMNEAIRPSLKFQRIDGIINLVCDKYLSDTDEALFLHGDCFPVATMSTEILLDRHLSAGCRSQSIQWCLTRKGIGHSFKEQRNLKLWPFGNIKIDGFIFQMFNPGFIHADNLSTDDEETIAKKLAAIERAYPARVAEDVSK